MLEIRNLNYIYNPGTPYEKKALDEISLTIEDGEFVGVIGATGSGKSTLIQHFNGLNKPTSGQILFDGSDILDGKYPMRQLRFQVGLVFQYPEYQLFETEVLKDISFGPRNQGLAEEEVLERARSAMAAVGLPESYEKKSPFELSGGEKRRAAIAGVLAMHPKMLVLDEPTAGLDPKGRDEILGLLKMLHERDQIAIVLVSHSMEDVADYVDRIIVMNRGRILFDDTPAAVFSRTRELEEVGLAAPQVTYIMQSLAQAGLAVDTRVTTLEEAERSIMKAVNGH